MTSQGWFEHERTAMPDGTVMFGWGPVAPAGPVADAPADPAPGAPADPVADAPADPVADARALGRAVAAALVEARLGGVRRSDSGWLLWSHRSYITQEFNPHWVRIVEADDELWLHRDGELLEVRMEHIHYGGWQPEERSWKPATPEALEWPDFEWQRDPFRPKWSPATRLGPPYSGITRRLEALRSGQRAASPLERRDGDAAAANQAMARNRLEPQRAAGRRRRVYAVLATLIGCVLGGILIPHGSGTAGGATVVYVLSVLGGGTAYSFATELADAGRVDEERILPCLGRGLGVAVLFLFLIAPIGAGLGYVLGGALA